MPARDGNGFIALASGRLRPALLLAAALAVLGAAPGTASAARISSQPTTYIAGASERNDVTITYDQAAGTYTFTDTGVTTISDEDIGPGGCEVTGNVATCPDIGSFGYPPSLNFFLGDGDDRLTILSANPAGRVFGSAGDGSDFVDASRVASSVSDNQLTGDSAWSQPEAGDTPGLAGDGDDVIFGGNATPSPPIVGFQIWGEGGADRLYAGSGDDLLKDGTPSVEDPVGEADLLDGGAGDDQLDQTEGADTLIGGAGDDRLGMLTFFASDNAVDSNSCGAGDDQALLYPGDVVDTSCEQAIQLITCPEGAGGPCSETLIASAPPPPVSRASARVSPFDNYLSWARNARASRPRVRLAPVVEKKVKPGRRVWVPLRFQRKQVGKALRGRTRVRARVAVKRRTATKTLSTKRTPFALKRAG